MLFESSPDNKPPPKEEGSPPGLGIPVYFDVTPQAHLKNTSRDSIAAEAGNYIQSIRLAHA